MKFLNLVGQRFGRLIVLARAANAADGHAQWSCRCDCGALVTIRAKCLRNGDTQSCGCLKDEVSGIRITKYRCQLPNLRHGHTSNGRATSEYDTWGSMIQRCENPANKSFPDYGGRGIQVCERWRASFEAFLRDMGPRPSPQHSIDRFPNNDGHYEPGNVRWATSKEQRSNQRSSFGRRTLDDEVITQQAFCHYLAIKPHAYRSLMARSGR